jgi:hypothetical protein
MDQYYKITGFERFKALLCYQWKAVGISGCVLKPPSRASGRPFSRLFLKKTYL